MENPFGVPGFRLTKTRSQPRPKYPVLDRLKTGMQTDSDSEGEYIPEYHRGRRLPGRGLCLRYTRPRHWSIKFSLWALPKFKGLAGECPQEHLQKLHAAVKKRKPDELEFDTAMLIAFPHSLHVWARSWFRSLPRRKLMTWGQVIDGFLQKYAV